MPQIKAAEKALRQTKKRTLRNNQVRQNLDYLSRYFKKAVAAKDAAKAEEFAKKMLKMLDKAAQKNIIKNKTAARRKSRLMKKVNALKK